MSSAGALCLEEGLAELGFAVLHVAVGSSEEIYVVGEFMLSCFISYLNMPLLKPTPKTTACKGSSRGSNSGVNS